MARLVLFTVVQSTAKCKDAQDAAARRLRKEAELNALNNGVSVVPDGQNGHRSLAAAVAEFLDETKLTKKPKTVAAYTTAMNYFTESCPKLYLEDIDRRDLLKFSAFLRDEKEQAPRSVYNKFENVMTFLKANGIRGLVGKNDWPRYTEEEPEIYELEELDKLLAACDEGERLWYEFFLMTGMREQEVMYTKLWGRSLMPHYEFFCHACKKTFSKSLTVAEHEKENIVCPHCRSKNVEQGWSAFSAITSKKSA